MKFADIGIYKVNDINDIKTAVAGIKVDRIDTELYKTDFKADKDVPFLKVNGDFVPMTRYAFTELCKELQVPVPVKFAEKVPHTMLSYIVDGLKNTNKEVCIFTKKDPPCVLHLRKYPSLPLKNTDIMDVCEEMIQQKSLAKCYLSDISLEVEMREKEGEEIIPGDPHHHAIRVVNSEVGIIGAYAQTGLLRTICWNSALISECVRWNYDYRRSYHYNLQDFRTKVFKMKSESDIIEKIRSSINRKMLDEDIVNTWRTLARRSSPLHADKIVGIDAESRKHLVSRVTERHRKRSEHYGKPGLETEMNAYYLSNRITAYAREIQDFQARNDLERLGGEVLLLALDKN